MMRLIITEEEKRHIKRLYEQVDNKCQSNVSNELLNKSKQYWINWLKNSSTITKIISGLYSDDEIKKFTPEEFNKIRLNAKSSSDRAIKKIQDTNKIVYYNSDNMDDRRKYEDNPDVVMFVRNNFDGTVYVNCKTASIRTSEENLNIMIHELQHVIHSEIKGKSGNLSTGMTTKRSPLISGPHTIKSPVSVDFGDEYLTKSYWKSKYDTLEQNMKTYVCDSNESQSRIAQTRQFLKLSPGQDITKEMLKNKKVLNNLQAELMCWGGREDNLSLDVFLSNLNQFANINKPNTLSGVS
jgi:hypothetical protein